MGRSFAPGALWRRAISRADRPRDSRAGAPVTDKSAFRLMRRREMRRALAMPPTDREIQYAELLAANEESRKFPGLLGVTMADLRAEVRTLLPPGRNDLVNHELAPHFRDMGINPLLFDWARRGALELYRYEDVLMVAEGGMASFFRGNVADTQTTGLARGLRDLAGATPVRLGRGAYVDDIYKATNPCHFLVDRLPRVHHLTTLGGLDESDCVTVAATSTYPRYALERVAPRVRVLEPRTLYHFDELFMLSTSARPIGHPFFFLDQGVLDFVIPKVTAGLPAPARRRRIYLSRFATVRRRLVNEEAIAAMLEARGFEILEMSELSPQEQLTAMREAEFVVGPHGAAFASLVAATPQNRVVEFFNPKRGTSAYAAMSIAVGAPYTPVFGTPVDDPSLDDPWRLDVAAVEAALDAPPTFAGGTTADR